MEMKVEHARYEPANREEFSRMCYRITTDTWRPPLITSAKVTDEEAGKIIEAMYAIHIRIEVKAARGRTISRVVRTLGVEMGWAYFVLYAEPVRTLFLAEELRLLSEFRRWCERYGDRYIEKEHW
jgi:hypothetical protein